jgi:Holliday junction resolvasome RuvABC endonuclease subunit
VTAVAGIDPAVSATGVALTDGFLATITAARPKGRRVDVNVRAARLHSLRRALTGHLGLPHPRPGLVVVEGYSLGGARGYAAAHLAEAGAVARLVAHDLGATLLEVPPSTLHLYATGDGNADKDLMVASARAHGGQPANGDEADAWWLRRLGLAVVGQADADPPEFAELRAGIVVPYREVTSCA